MAVAIISQLQQESDTFLVAQAQNDLPGESEALQILIDRYRARVERRATAILGSRNEAEDAAQDVFLSVFRALPRYVEHQPFAHWLERITTNTCRMHLRTRRRHERRLQAVVNEELSRPVARPRPDIRRDAIYLCGRLSDVNRNAFVLRTAAQMPYREIASMLGISQSAAKMRVRRARIEAARIAGEQNHQATPVAD